MSNWNNKSLLDCLICGKVFSNPVSLPCGETICKEHSVQCASLCLFCKEQHMIPMNGFPSNLLAERQLETKIDSVMIPTFSLYNIYKKIMQDAATEFIEIQSIYADPENYIYEYFSDCIRQVDIRKEVLIEKINDYSLALVESIKRRHHECLKNCNEASMKSEIGKIVFECQRGVEQIDSMFTSLEMNDAKLNELQSQTICDNLLNLMETVKHRYVGSLFTKLVVNDKLQIESVFGELAVYNPQVPSAFLTSHEKKSLTRLIGFQTKSFSLLWSGNRDGFEVSAFHKLCDGKKNTLTLVKSTSGSIFGGFTSIPWESPTKELERTYSDNLAFLFSLKNNLKNPLLFKIKQDDYQQTHELQHAVFHSKDFGPAFGQHFGTHNGHVEFRYDLIIDNSSNEEYLSHIHLGSDYEFPEGLTSSLIHGGNGINFQIKDIEVFEVY